MEIGACGTICDKCQLASLCKDAGLSKVLSDIALESGLSPDAILEKFQCAGWHSAGNRCGNKCEVRKCCVIAKKLDNCGLCDSFESCDIIKDFENDGLALHRQAIEHLRTMQSTD
jgi:hypothetical protein